MKDTICPPAGFESHWDAEWFKAKSSECRRLANLLSDNSQKAALVDLAEDFQRQSEHAEQLAKIAIGKLIPNLRDRNALGASPTR